MNLTGATVEMAITNYPNENLIVTTLNGISVPFPLTGVAEISIDATLQVGFRDGVHTYTMRVTDSLGDVYDQSRGFFKVVSTEFAPPV